MSQFEIINSTRLSNAIGVFDKTLPDKNFAGFQLVSSSGFCNLSKNLKIELQSADPAAISILEKCGSKFYSRYLDDTALKCAVAPVDYLELNYVPRAKIPPENLFLYYFDPFNRGYLHDSGSKFDLWVGVKCVVVNTLKAIF